MSSQAGPGATRCYSPRLVCHPHTRHIYAMLAPMHNSAVPAKPDDERRIIIPMPKELVDRIDEYRWQNRLPSRAEAIRQLIKEGLRAKK